MVQKCVLRRSSKGEKGVSKHRLRDNNSFRDRCNICVFTVMHQTLETLETLEQGRAAALFLFQPGIPF